MPEIEIPYQPRTIQLELHHAVAGKRFAVFNIHRRFGKTVWAINQLVWDILNCTQPNPRGAYIAPLYRQVKQIAWEYMKHYTSHIPKMKYNEAELRADFPNGARISLYGGSNAHALRGIYLDCVVIDETSQIPPSLWYQVLTPCLSDRRGNAYFIGTPFGMKNLFYDMYEIAGEHPEWARRIVTVDESGLIHPDELAMIKRQMPKEEYEQEFLCSWSSAIRGAFYGKEMSAAENDGRITSVPYDKQYPVITAWDIGVSDATVVTYWQIVGTEARCIRCDAFQGYQLADIIKQVFSYGYLFSQHIAPHDVEVREWGSGSRHRQARELGIYFTVAPKDPVDVGIDKVRTLLDRTIFDRKHCGDLIEALKNYRSEYNELRQVFSDKPLHDWSSDYADSVRYFAVTRLATHSKPWQKSLPIDYSTLDSMVY